jgi:hypothetical protein
MKGYCDEFSGSMKAGNLFISLEIVNIGRKICAMEFD